MSPFQKLGWAYESRKVISALPKPKTNYNEKGGIYWTTPSGEQHRFLDAVARYGDRGAFTQLDPATFHAILGQIYLCYNYKKHASTTFYIHSKKHNFRTDVSRAELARYVLSHYDLECSFDDVDDDLHAMLIVTNSNQCSMTVDRSGYATIKDGINMNAENMIFEREVFRMYMDRIWEAMTPGEREALAAPWREE